MPPQENPAARGDAAQPDDGHEHDHVPKPDSWVILRTNALADLMEPAHYPVAAACQECHRPIYAHHFAAPWLLKEAYKARYGEPGTDPAPGEAHGA